jgi:hypothetical protein
MPNNALERTAAPLLRSTVAAVRTRVVRATAPVGGGRSAWRSTEEDSACSQRLSRSTGRPRS